MSNKSLTPTKNVVEEAMAYGDSSGEAYWIQVHLPGGLHIGGAAHPIKGGILRLDTPEPVFINVWQVIACKVVEM